MLMRKQYKTEGHKAAGPHTRGGVGKTDRTQTWGTQAASEVKEPSPDPKIGQLKSMIAGMRSKAPRPELDPTMPEYADAIPGGPARGRGAALNPPNRFERVRHFVSGEIMDQASGLRQEVAASHQSGLADLSLPVLHGDQDQEEGEWIEWGRGHKTMTIKDQSKSLINRVDSEDLPLKWTANPYRGCEHGCIYCFARPTHEYAGMSSGLDFESKILVNYGAAGIMKKELSKSSWEGEPIMFSGVTDCYQPVEAKLGITRECLKVAAKARQPISLITKNRLILRDLDLLEELNQFGGVHVAISLTTLDNQLSAKIEPRASSPADRLWAIRRLASAGIPVMVMIAPIIPGLNDWEIPNLLKAAADHGARAAGKVLLRLPYQVEHLFTDWLEREYPERRQKVLSLLRECRDGKLYDAQFGDRLTGTGPIADQITSTFGVFAKRYHLDQAMPPLNSAEFRRPEDDYQMGLFG